MHCSFCLYFELDAFFILLCFCHFKAIVHPKMRILSSFTHTQVVPNLYECICSAEHKGRYSEECGKQSSSGAPLTSIVFHSYYGSQWCPKQPDYKLSSEYLPLCSAEQRHSYRQRWKVTNYIYSRYCNWVAFLCTCTFLSNIFNL